MNNIFVLAVMTSVVFFMTFCGGCKGRSLYETVTPSHQEMIILKQALDAHENGLPYRIKTVQRLINDKATWTVCTQLQNSELTGGNCYIVKMAEGKCIVKMIGVWNQ